MKTHPVVRRIPYPGVCPNRILCLDGVYRCWNPSNKMKKCKSRDKFPRYCPLEDAD